MYTLNDAIGYTEHAAVIFATSMLITIGFLYVRVKWFNSGYYEHRIVINKALKISEANAKILMAVIIYWMLLKGIEVRQ